MSLSLVDPNISYAHNKQLEIGEGSWIVLGYPPESKDQLVLIGSGNGGLQSIKKSLPQDQIAFVILYQQSQLIQILWCPEVGGVKKARAMVHGRAVAAQFDTSNTISASSVDDLSVAEAKSTHSSTPSNSAAPASPPSRPPPQPKEATESATTVQNLDDDEDDDDDDTDSIVDGYQDVDENTAQHNRQAEVERQRAMQEEEERVEIERRRIMERELLARQEAEQARRVELEQQKRQELEHKRRKELEERRRLETEHKLRVEMEHKRRVEADEKRKAEIVKQKALEQERMNKIISSGQVALSGKLSALTKSNIWRRRYFELTSKALVLYKEDLSSKTPIQAIVLNKSTEIVDSYEELLIKNSLKLSNQEDDLFVYVDDAVSKTKLVNAIQSAMKH